MSLYRIIQKQACRAECGNYRGISLLSVVGEINARIVSDRVKVLKDELVMDLELVEGV